MTAIWARPGRRRAEHGDKGSGNVKMSVVVAVYNPGEYIEPCIASLLDQSLPAGEYEVIFVDDGSTDATPARLDEVAAAHDNVTAIHIPNSGWPGKPRNVGIDAAVGEYVYFVDHDDSLADEALERMYDMAHRNGADVIIGKIVGHGRRVPRTLFRQNYERCTLQTAPLMESMTPHKGFRRAFLDAHGIRFPEGRRRLEDHVFVVEAYLRAEVVSVLADYTCYHHIARPDAGNAGFEHIVPRSYFGYLGEGVDIVERLTEPGPLRDLVLRRWYSVEMLNRVGSKSFAGYSKAYRREMYDAIRTLAIERFTSPGIWAELGAQYRVRSELLRADRYEDLLRLAEFETGLDLSCRLEGFRWSSTALELDLMLTIVQRDGSPALVRRDGEWVLEIPIAGVSETAREVNKVLQTQRAELLLRHRDTKQQMVLPASSAALWSPATTPVCAVLGTWAFDPARVKGVTLDGGVWDLFVRLVDWGAGRSLTRRIGVDGVPSTEAPPRPGIVGSPPRVVIPYWTVAGNLSIDLDQATKSLMSAVTDAAGPVAMTRDDLGFDLTLPLSLHVGEHVTLPVRLHALDPNGQFDLVVPGTIRAQADGAVLQCRLPAFTPCVELTFETVDGTPTESQRLGVRLDPTLAGRAGSPSDAHRNPTRSTDQ